MKGTFAYLNTTTVIRVALADLLVSELAREALD
jgi:hypothetical protein